MAKKIIKYKKKYIDTYMCESERESERKRARARKGERKRGGGGSD